MLQGMKLTVEVQSNCMFGELSFYLTQRYKKKMKTRAETMIFYPCVRFFMQLYFE